MQVEVVLVRILFLEVLVHVADQVVEHLIRFAFLVSEVIAPHDKHVLGLVLQEVTDEVCVPLLFKLVRDFPSLQVFVHIFE